MFQETRKFILIEILLATSMVSVFEACCERIELVRRIFFNQIKTSVLVYHESQKKSFKLVTSHFFVASFHIINILVLPFPLFFISEWFKLNCNTLNSTDASLVTCQRLIQEYDPWCLYDQHHREKQMPSCHVYAYLDSCVSFSSACFRPWTLSLS